MMGCHGGRGGMVVVEKLRWVEINDIGYFRAYERGESNWSWEGGEKRDGGNWRLQLLEGKGRGWFAQLERTSNPS